MVVGSINSIFALPFTSFSEVLLRRAESTLSSPWRKKRGMLGCIITSLRATTSPPIMP